MRCRVHAVGAFEGLEAGQFGPLVTHVAAVAAVLVSRPVDARSMPPTTNGSSPHLWRASSNCSLLSQISPPTHSLLGAGGSVAASPPCTLHSAPARQHHERLQHDLLA